MKILSLEYACWSGKDFEFNCKTDEGNVKILFHPDYGMKGISERKIFVKVKENYLKIEFHRQHFQYLRHLFWKWMDANENYVKECLETYQF